MAAVVQKYIWLIAIFCSLSALATIRRPLNSYIRHYERLDYNLKDFHSRVRRSVISSPFAISDLKFKAFGKQFHIRLRKDHAIFSPEYSIVDGHGEPINVDLSKFVEGDVKGHFGSYVHGVVHKGRFQGTIKMGGEVYHVEPARRHFKHPQSFHSVIYKVSDVKANFNYGHDTMRTKKRPTSYKVKNERDSLKPDITREQEKAYREGYNIDAEHVLKRTRRGVKNAFKNTCVLKLVADHKFTRKFLNKENVIYQMVNHYKAAEYIFRNQTFNITKPADRWYHPQGIGFRVGSIVVYDGYSVPARLKPEYMSVANLLEMFSSEDHSKVCESFLFTDRSFEKGIIGLAWIGYPQGQAGGICDRYANFGGKLRSYNTGLVTFKLYARDLPPAVTEITFAHELGHAFGAHHDPKECQPTEKQGGKYIMYDKATTGTKRNNRYFSKCSIDSMVPVINAKGLDQTYGCFVNRRIAICGNGIVEYPEICDCGTASTCNERCCHPYDGTNRSCLLRHEAFECSPSRGPCCSNETCRVYPQWTRCREATDCKFDGRCDGRTWTCAPSQSRPDNTTCASHTMVCSKGYCNGSICLLYGFKGCMCENRADQCKVCCMNEGKCTVATNISSITNLKSPFVLPGNPCHDYLGYCDALGDCQMIDMDGPFKTLLKTFFSFNNVKTWLAKYWFVVTACTLMLISFMIAFLTFCTRYTPSDNPEKEYKKPTKRIIGKKNARQRRPPPRKSDAMPMMTRY